MGLIYLALVLAPYQYGFNETTTVEYDTTITFDGFIPMFGGMEGLVVVSMGLSVVGEAPVGKSALQAVSEITSFKITFNEVTIPLGLETVTDFFPRTKIELSPSGKILKTDAPDIRPPIRLPGLDVKRFPDITYVPIVFPDADLSVGSEWSFEKPFSDGPMKYRCKLLKIEGDLVTVQMEIEQEYVTFEDEALEVVDKQEDAVRSVKTVMVGEGTVVFNVREGLIHSLKMVAESTGEEFSMDGEALKTRKLRTTMELVRKVDETAGVDSRDGKSA